MSTNGEKPTIPPERKPVSEFPTPSHAVAFYTELVVRTDPAYKANAPVKRGTRYSTITGAKRDVIDTYPDLFFLQEVKYGQDDQRVLWHWATDEQAHDTYNADVNYVANAITYPAFTRVYTVRRELYEQQPTLPIGSPLPGIIAVTITSPGQNHTEARGVIDGTSVAIDFVVDSGGSLISAVITNTGDELIQNGTPITIIGDGQDSSAIAVAQPVGCVLTSQKKEELQQNDPLQHELVKVTRVYETLPGPWIYSSRIDKDGAIIKTKTRRQVADFIVDQDLIINGEWSQTWHEGDDNFVAKENIETRPLPGNPITDTKVDEDGKVITTTKILVDKRLTVSGETLIAGVWTKTFEQEVDDSSLVKVHQASNKVAWQMQEARDIPGNPLVSTKVNEDGTVTTITKILSDTTTIVSGETLVGGIWTKTYKDEVSDLVAYMVTEARPVPGNPLVSTRIEEDGIPTTITKILKDTTTIISSEAIVSGQWIKTFKEEVSDLVANQVEEKRPIPGNPIPDTQLDKDGVEVSIVRTLKQSSFITTQEIINGSVWMRTESDPVSDLVSWEKVTARVIPGNPVLSYKIDPDKEIRVQQTILKERTTITPSATSTPTTVTTVAAEEVTELVANEVTDAKLFLDEAFYSISIENIIPREFMAFIPTTVESHIIAGTAFAPTLGFGQLSVSNKQLDKLLYENRVTTLGTPTLPITHTNQELTEQFGGGVLNVNYSLVIHGTVGIDQGYLVTRSSVLDLGNGMDVKETAQLDGTAWPVTTGTAWDQERQIEYPFAEQIVPVTYVVFTGPNVLETLEPVDQWRNKLRAVVKIPVNVDPTTAIVTIKYAPFRFPGLLTPITFGSGFAYYVRASDSQLCQHKIRTWWENNVGTPVVSVDEIIMDDPIISTLNNVTTLAYSGPCLHDAFTSFGVLFWPATTPSYSDYVGTWIGNEKVVAASVEKTDIPNQWKIQTISVVMR